MLYIDTETWGEVPIKHGTYAYVSTCEPMLVTWAVDDGPVECWDRTANPVMPTDLEHLLRSEELITAHNSMFDRNVLKYGLGVEIPIPRWRCTMTRALAHALPGGLDVLCETVGVPVDKAKLKTGKALVRLFCQPRPKSSKIRRATRETHPKEWAEFIEYARQDIVATRELDKKLPRWNVGAEELAIWFLDQKINDRGMYVDVELAEAAVAAVERAQSVLAARTDSLTSGRVESTTQRDQLLAHILAEYGIELPDMQASTIERRLNDPGLPPALKELLAIRLAATTSSTAKYRSLLNAVMPDNRLRGTLQYNGAGRTRRDAGRTFQPQNLPSKGLPPHEEVDAGIEAMKAGCEDLIYENPMAIASHAIRGCIIAPQGKKLVISDLANIEGRDAAWLAGESWKLQAFRDFDAGTGPDLYKLAYARAFKVPQERVMKEQRQVGKVLELMCQYQGNAGAFVTGAATYGLDLEELATTAWDTLPSDVVYEAEDFLKWAVKHKMPLFGLSDRAYVVCNALVRLWRRANSAISSGWKPLEDAAKAAVENPGVQMAVGRFKILREGAWLRIRLPSERYLCYPSPRVVNGKLSYMGVNQYTRQWSRIATYGGKLFENACQALAGDVMKANLERIEDAGYEGVLRVHDEVVTEASDSREFNAEHLSSLLATVPEWAEGMPLAAAGFETYRYRKE